MAPTNNYLAKINKPPHVAAATKKRIHASAVVVVSYGKIKDGTAVLVVRRTDATRSGEASTIGSSRPAGFGDVRTN